MPTPTRHTCPDGVRCARVNVNGVTATLSLHGDLSPVEAVAAFLRDIAECSTDDELFHELANQLDPITPFQARPMDGSPLARHLTEQEGGPPNERYPDPTAPEIAKEANR